MIILTPITFLLISHRIVCIILPRSISHLFNACLAVEHLYQYLNMYVDRSSYYQLAALIIQYLFGPRLLQLLDLQLVSGCSWAPDLLKHNYMRICDCSYLVEYATGVCVYRKGESCDSLWKDDQGIVVVGGWVIATVSAFLRWWCSGDGWCCDVTFWGCIKHTTASI